MKRNILGAIWVMGMLSFAGFCLSSCTPELDVQQAYDFSLQTLPVQKDIVKGAVAEIRCSLKAEGDFARWGEIIGRLTLGLWRRIAHECGNLSHGQDYCRWKSSTALSF